MLDDQTMRQNMFEDTIGNLMAINTALRAEIQRYTEQLDKATKAMDRWTPAVGRNGRMNVGGLVEMIVAEIERKDEAIKAAIKLLRKWNDSQALQILNKALSTEEDGDDS